MDRAECNAGRSVSILGSGPELVAAGLHLERDAEDSDDWRETENRDSIRYLVS